MTRADGHDTRRARVAEALFGEIALKIAIKLSSLEREVAGPARSTLRRSQEFS